MSLLGVPFSYLPLYIDIHVTTEMLVGIFTFKILLAGIDVSVIIIIEVVLNIILCHGVTSIFYQSCCLFFLKVKV
jgi:hypothetical protein